MTASNLADLVTAAAARGADRRALIFRDEVLTWGDLASQVDRTARGLRALDPEPGDRVAIALPNVPQFAVAFFATLRAGLTAVPVNPGYPARELAHVLGDSGATVLVGTADVVGRLAGVRTDLPALRDLYSVGAAAGATPLASLIGAGPATAPLEPAGTGGDDLAVLLYTSGTAGRPKGAMLSHRALLANLEQLARISPAVYEPDDVLLLGLPLFHAYGLGPGLCAVAYHACAGLLLERFDPHDALEQVRRHRVTALLGVPQMYLAWSLLATGSPAPSTDAWASVRLAVSGAAPLDTATQHRFLELTRHPVFEGYGLTETAPVLTSTLVSPVPKPRSIGRPVPGVELKLIGADGSEVDVVEPEEDEVESSGTDPGEIWVRGANLFSGYWPDGAGGPDPDGWWGTGDVAYADADGDLFLVDRLGELILVSGFNVYPREVEDVLTAHPAVAAAAVLGAPHPYTGQTVKAYVVLAPGAAVTADELVGHCERNLARFKCPTAVEFVAELPYSVIGKVRKGELRAGSAGSGEVG